MPRLRKIYWLMIFTSLIITAVGVQAGGLTFFTAPKDSVVTQEAADGKIYNIANSNRNVDYFVPNKTVAEWSSFKAAADTYLTDVTVTEVTK